MDRPAARRRPLRSPPQAVVPATPAAHCGPDVRAADGNCGNAGGRMPSAVRRTTAWPARQPAVQAGAFHSPAAAGPEVAILRQLEVSCESAASFWTVGFLGFGHEMLLHKHLNLLAERALLPF